MSNKKSRRQRDAPRVKANEVQRQCLGAREDFHEARVRTTERHLTPASRFTPPAWRHPAIIDSSRASDTN